MFCFLFFLNGSIGEGVFIRAIKAILVHPLYCWSLRGRAVDASSLWLDIRQPFILSTLTSHERVQKEAPLTKADVNTDPWAQIAI